jgi:hypothetical protein
MAGLSLRPPVYLIPELVAPHWVPALQLACAPLVVLRRTAWRCRRPG